MKMPIPIRFRVPPDRIRPRQIHRPHRTNPPTRAHFQKKGKSLSSAGSRKARARARAWAPRGSGSAIGMSPGPKRGGLRVRIRRLAPRPDRSPGQSCSLVRGWPKLGCAYAQTRVHCDGALWGKRFGFRARDTAARGVRFAYGRVPVPPHHHPCARASERETLQKNKKMNERAHERAGRGEASGAAAFAGIETQAFSRRFAPRRLSRARNRAKKNVSLARSRARAGRRERGGGT